jgi:hypothetical protein
MEEKPASESMPYGSMIARLDKPSGQEQNHKPESEQKAKIQKSAMMSASLLRAQIETRMPSAFALYKRPERNTIPAGIPVLDEATGGIPKHALTEICGVGKTSVLVSLLARASREHYCALVDAKDAFDPITAASAGVDLSRLLWVRCGKSQQKLKPLEQAFKVADMLLQSSGFGLIVVDLSDIGEKFIRNVPLSTWFRFSRTVEKQPTALVFLSREPHAASCSAMVLQVASGPATFSGNLLTDVPLRIDTVRTKEKKGAQSATPEFSMKAQWA